jgi:succinate dehydrogenase/fumarate reductase flavoprotein subunit
MKDIHIEHKHLQTDILVIGGGIGGLATAVAVKEQNPDVNVLLIEKNTAGYSGKANRGGGVLQYFDFKRCTPDQFLGYHVHNVGKYLGDQELLHKYVSMNNDMITRLESWGVKVPRDEDGQLKLLPTGPMTFMIGVDLDITLQVRKTAEKLGVQIIDKVSFTDLLTDNGAVTGATAYSLLDGEYYGISAKAVVLATGSQNYKIQAMWNGRGEGISAAYRAGVEMCNTEFGNFAQIYKAKSHHDAVFTENVMYNGLGENISKNFRRFPEADISSTAVAEWYKQISAGRGPVTIRPEEYAVTAHGDALFTTAAVWNRPYGLKIWQQIYGKAANEDQGNKEILMSFVGEQSPVKVGHDMQTSVQGLFAVGDISYSGSKIAGAVPAPPGRNRGSGILNAVFNGLLAAESMVDFVQQQGIVEPNVNLVSDTFKRNFAPLYRESGITAESVIEQVREAIGPVENSVYMSQHRLDIGIRKVMKVKATLQDLYAKDLHDLSSCHEAEAMVLCAEMQFRAASQRKESRGWFLREDYPKMDNENWLKYIIVQNVDGEMQFRTEDIDVEKMRVKPPVH